MRPQYDMSQFDPLAKAMGFLQFMGQRKAQEVDQRQSAERLAMQQMQMQMQQEEHPLRLQAAKQGLTEGPQRMQLAQEDSRMRGEQLGMQQEEHPLRMEALQTGLGDDSKRMQLAALSQLAQVDPRMAPFVMEFLKSSFGYQPPEGQAQPAAIDINALLQQHKQ